MLAAVIFLVKLSMDGLPAFSRFTANLAEVALLILLLVVLARLRSGLLALATAVAALMQARILNPNAFFAPPQPIPFYITLLFLAGVMAMALVSCLGFIAMLRRPSSRRIPLFLTLVMLASFLPELLVMIIQWHSRGVFAWPMAAWFYGSILPTILVLAIPYLVGRRQTVAG